MPRRKSQNNKFCKKLSSSLTYKAVFKVSVTMPSKKEKIKRDRERKEKMKMKNQINENDKLVLNLVRET